MTITVRSSEGNRGDVISGLLRASPLEHRGRTEGWKRALVTVVGDAVVAHDWDALGVAVDGLAVLGARAPIAPDSPWQSEDLTWLAGVRDLSDWVLHRSSAEVKARSIDPQGHAASLLRLVMEAPGSSSRGLAVAMGVDETEISRVGKGLSAAGLVYKERRGRSNAWLATPSGRAVVENLGLVGEREVEPVPVLSPAERGWHLLDGARKARIEFGASSEALRSLDEALVYADRAEDDVLRSAIASERATTYRLMGEGAAAREAVEEAERIASSCEDPRVEANALLQRARLDVGDPRVDTRPHVRRAIELLDPLPDERSRQQQLWCSYALADGERRAWSLGNAFRIAKEAEVGFRAIGEGYGRLRCIEIQASITRLAGQFDVALDLLAQLREQSRGRYEGLYHRSLFHQGEIARARGDVEGALRCLQPLEQSYLASSVPLYWTQVLGALGASHFQGDDLPRAQTYLEGALAVLAGLPSHRDATEAVLLRRLGAVWQRLDRASEARDCYRAALDLYRTTVPSPVGAAECLVGLADVDHTPDALAGAVEALRALADGDPHTFDHGADPSRDLMSLGARIAISPWALERGRELAEEQGSSEVRAAFDSVGAALRAELDLDVGSSGEVASAMSREPVVVPRML